MRKSSWLTLSPYEVQSVHVQYIVCSVSLHAQTKYQMLTGQLCSIVSPLYFPCFEFNRLKYAVSPMAMFCTFHMSQYNLILIRNVTPPSVITMLTNCWQRYHVRHRVQVASLQRLMQYCMDNRYGYNTHVCMSGTGVPLI